MKDSPSTRVELLSVRETRQTVGEVSLFTQPDWGSTGLFQGTTGADADFGLAGAQPVRDVLRRWWRLHEALPVDGIVLARQVHGAELLLHDAVPSGFLLAGRADGHLTGRPRLALAVTIADCVPVFLHAPARPAVALLHAGWRGTAAGILERGIAALTRLAGDATGLRVHLGPAICGDCYEVGPEVHEALALPVPARPAPVDLRALLRDRARAAGVSADRISMSAFCTRHDDAFFSHRGGDAGRQIALLALPG